MFKMIYIYFQKQLSLENIVLCNINFFWIMSPSSGQVAELLVLDIPLTSSVSAQTWRWVVDIFNLWGVIALEIGVVSIILCSSCSLSIAVGLESRFQNIDSLSLCCCLIGAVSTD